MELHRLVQSISEDNGAFVENRIRASAADLFGQSTLSRLLARCLRDLVLLALPHETDPDQMETTVCRLLTVVKANFADYVQALHAHASTTISDDPSGILAKHPWVDATGIVWRNIGTCVTFANSDGNIGVLVSKLLCASPQKSHEIDPLLRTNGPGLSVVVWLATGKFVNELECDCRGRVDLLQMPSNGAVVLGAAVKRSSSAFGEAKRQLTFRFKVIGFILERVCSVPRASLVFIGRVFYSNSVSTEGSVCLDSEENASGGGSEILSFYFHKM